MYEYSTTLFLYGKYNHTNFPTLSHFTVVSLSGFRTFTVSPGEEIDLRPDTKLLLSAIIKASHD